jgi:adenylosuccinate lyase
LKQVLLRCKDVTKAMSAKELDRVMEYSSYVGSAPEMVDKVVAKAKKVRK